MFSFFFFFLCYSLVRRKLHAKNTTGGRGQDVVTVRCVLYTLFYVFFFFLLPLLFSCDVSDHHSVCSLNAVSLSHSFSLCNTVFRSIPLFLFLLQICRLEEESRAAHTREERGGEQRKGASFIRVAA
jgi:hypothetical protein